MYAYPQNNNYGPSYNGYNGYAPIPQQPPAAQSASANKGLMVITGLAVVGAAAFGGVFLMNSNSEPAPTAATNEAPVAAPSTIINLPSTIDIPSLAPSQNAPASVPVIVNNPPLVRVNAPAAAPRPAFAPAPAPAPAPAAPAPAPKPASGPGGVSVQTPVGSVSVPGQGPGGVVVTVPGGQAPAGGQEPTDPQPEEKKPEEKKPEPGDFGKPKTDAGSTEVELPAQGSDPGQSPIPVPNTRCGLPICL